MPKQIINIAIFASGAGSNAQKIVKYFENREDVLIKLIVSNNKEAGVLHLAQKEKIDSIVISRDNLYHSNDLMKELKNYQIHFIVLAGFLWLIPEAFIDLYPNRMVNIHPSLLPKYGGKGMYGHFVHDAVFRAKEKYTGISIHFVNGKYDEGSIVFQEKCEISPSDNAGDIAKKVQILEHSFYPKILDSLVSSLIV